MKAKEFAAFAARATAMATELRQGPQGDFAESIALAVFHLNTAASKLRQIAEFKAEQERVNAATAK